MKFDVWFKISSEVEYHMGSADMMADSCISLFGSFAKDSNIHNLTIHENKINNNPVFEAIAQQDGFFDILLQPEEDSPLYLVLEAELMGFEQIRDGAIVNDLFVKLDVIDISLHYMYMYDAEYTVKD